MDTIEKKLDEMGLELPVAHPPLAEYVLVKQVGDLVWTSGQVPLEGGKSLHLGKVGLDVTVDEGAECARICALNCLAAVKSAVGNLDRVEEVIQVRGFVNSDPDFGDQPEVIDGASELLVELFGDRGRHVRSAVGCSSLPRNVPVELEMLVRVSG